MVKASAGVQALTVMVLVVAAVLSGLVFAAFLGLGLHREASSGVTVLTAAGLVLMPPVAVGLVSRSRQGLASGAAAILWSGFLFLTLPVYFPQERVEAVASGLGALRLGPGWDGLATQVTASMPEDPGLSRPQTPEAVAAPEPVAPEPLDLADDQIALPFEGEGRRLSVPVVFEHGGREVELWMMLDTGATYTTLPRSVLAELGIAPGPDAPEVTLHTANGERQARFALADKVWLGNLPIQGVALAECDNCASGEVSGLLGLNVSGGFNLTIDSDRREVVFTERAAHKQTLDINLFTDVSARYTRFSGGRVEVELMVNNRSDRPIERAVGEVRCDEGAWRIPVYDIPPGQTRSAIERLPRHERCDGYRISLADAAWGER